MKWIVVTATAVAAVSAGAFATPASAQATVEESCEVIDVSAFVDRTHVRCAVSQQTRMFNNRLGQTTIEYYSVANDSPLANSLVTLGVAARAAGRPLAIIFSTDAAQNPPGCLVSDCRRALSVRLVY